MDKLNHAVAVPGSASDASAGRSRERRRQVTESQRRTAAHLVAAGSPPEVVCRQLNISRDQLKRMHKRRDFQQWRNAHLDQMAEVQASHKLRLVEQNEIAYRAHLANLQDENGHVRLKAVEQHWLQLGLTPAAPPTSSVQIGEVNVSAAQQNVNLEVAETARDVMKELPDLLKAAAEIDPNRHVRQGDEALPQALLARVGEVTRRAEMVEADFIPEPTEPSES